MEVTAALTAMYNSTGGALWKRKKGWTVGDPCKDSWEGIECVCPGGEQVSIIILNLASNNMGSAIPKETFATGFKELQKIDLSLNHLRGPLPRLDSDELFNLEYVYLQQEDSPFKADTLTGDVSDLWGLYNLKELNIRNNHGLNGTLPQDIGRKVNLLSLVDMAGTGISGDLPESFWSIPSLSNVDISGLGLKGSIGEGVVEMQDFHVFLASENQLTGTIPAFHPFAFQKSHSTIILNNNKLENIPAAFFNAGVQDLAMSNNSLRGLLPPEVVMAKGLQHFFIDHNQLSGPIPTSLCSLVGLVEFKASFNYFSSIPDCFGEQLSNLQYLDLFNNVFTGTLPMNAFCGMGSLKQLQLQNNVNLGGALSPCITAWGDLEVIIIDRTQISGTIPVELFSLKKLDTIILSQSKFNGSIPDMFDKTPNVRAVVFQSSHVGEIVLTPHFVGTIPKTLFGLTALESLTLQFNRLSGTIPDLFGKAQYLSQIALNNNLLEGTVPQSIVDALKQPKPALMNSTRMLFLNSNLLTGTLPDFSKSQNTEAIVINSNQFVGYIPLVYNKSYTWLNSTGTFYDKNRFMTFFSGMRLFPPVPLFAKYMSAGNGVGFYPTGHLSVDGNPLNTVNRDAQQTIQVEAQFLCDSPDFWGKGDPGIFMKVEGDADALDSISPSTGEGDSGAIQVGAASWLVPVVSKIPQNASYAAAKGNVTFQIPSDVLQALPLGSLEFSIWFWGNTRANESDVSNHISRGEQLSVGSLPNAVLYDPNPPIQEIFPKEGRKWGCAYINVTGSSFSDTGSSNIKCRFTPLPAVGEGRKVSQVAVAAFDTPGSCINDTAVGCFVGVDNSTGYSLADYLVSVSLDRGEHWSQQVGEDANLTYTFTDDCSVSAEIPSLRTDCLCDMCECTSAGSCSMNTTQPPTCACLEGFTGENCDQCLPLFWGIDCKPCPTCNSPHGTCQDTKLGSGDCSCEMWYAGSNCGWYYKYWLIAALPSCLFVTVVFLAWKCCLKKRFAASRKAERIPLRGVQDRWHSLSAPRAVCRRSMPRRPRKQQGEVVVSTLEDASGNAKLCADCPTAFDGEGSRFAAMASAGKPFGTQCLLDPSLTPKFCGLLRVALSPSYVMTSFETRLACISCGSLHLLDLGKQVLLASIPLNSIDRTAAIAIPDEDEEESDDESEPPADTPPTRDYTLLTSHSVSDLIVRVAETPAPGSCSVSHLFLATLRAVSGCLHPEGIPITPEEPRHPRDASPGAELQQDPEEEEECEEVSDAPPSTVAVGGGGALCDTMRTTSTYGEVEAAVARQREQASGRGSSPAASRQGSLSAGAPSPGSGPPTPGRHAGSPAPSTPTARISTAEPEAFSDDASSEASRSSSGSAATASHSSRGLSSSAASAAAPDPPAAPSVPPARAAPRHIPAPAAPLPATPPPPLHRRIRSPPPPVAARGPSLAQQREGVRQVQLQALCRGVSATARAAEEQAGRLEEVAGRLCGGRRGGGGGGGYAVGRGGVPDPYLDRAEVYFYCDSRSKGKRFYVHLETGKRLWKAPCPGQALPILPYDAGLAAVVGRMAVCSGGARITSSEVQAWVEHAARDPQMQRHLPGLGALLQAVHPSLLAASLSQLCGVPVEVAAKCWQSYLQQLAVRPLPDRHM